jgi:cell division protein FtsQ
MLLILAGVLLAALAAWGLVRSPLLDVDRVEVHGAVHVDPAEVRSASHVHQGMAMADVATAAAARRIRALPWVDTVQVARHWPSRVTITLVERVPVAAAPARSGAAIVDRRGRVLAVGPAAPPDRPLLLGLPPAGAPGTRLSGRVHDLLTVAGALPASVVPRLAGVIAADGGQIELRLRPTGVVRLGTPDQLGEKMVALETVLAQVDLSHLAVLDVRVPASPAVTRA